MNNRNPFKAGDKVRCIDRFDGHSPYSVGKIYTVRYPEGATSIRIEGPGLSHFGWGASADCFELYIPTTLESAQENVATAQAELEKAQANLEEAMKAEEEAAKFTEADLKPGLVVNIDGPLGGDRVLVKAGALWSLLDPKSWTQANAAKGAKEAVRMLNAHYSRTNKTLAEVI